MKRTFASFVLRGALFLQDIERGAVKVVVAVADLDNESFANPLLIKEERGKDLIVSSGNQKTSPRRRRDLELKKSE